VLSIGTGGTAARARPNALFHASMTLKPAPAAALTPPSAVGVTCGGGSAQRRWMISKNTVGRSPSGLVKICSSTPCGSGSGGWVLGMFLGWGGVGGGNRCRRQRRPWLCRPRHEAARTVRSRFRQCCPPFLPESRHDSLREAQARPTPTPPKPRHTPTKQQQEQRRTWSSLSTSSPSSSTSLYCSRYGQYSCSRQAVQPVWPRRLVRCRHAAQEPWRLRCSRAEAHLLRRQHIADLLRQLAVVVVRGAGHEAKAAKGGPAWYGQGGVWWGGDDVRLVNVWLQI
jgi:hypothetical protein